MMKVDLPAVIPLFPLPGALLLPRARLPLHLFEPRYLAMLDDVLKTRDRLIGMIQPAAGGATGAPRLNAIGCAGRLTAFSETDDGRYMITLSGVSRFRIRAETPGFTPYRRAEIDWQPFAADCKGAESDAGLQRPRFLAQLKRYFESQSLSTDWSGIADAEDEMLINALAMLCPFTPEDKQALLEAPSLADRRETLEALIAFSLLGGDDGGEVMQ